MIAHEIRTALTGAIERALGEPGVDPLLAPARQPGFDLQANFAMKLAKQLGRAPRELARQVADELGDGLLDTIEVSGPGFLNLGIASDALAADATTALNDERLGVPRPAPQTVFVDYSAPNVAKEMHVGHLRSTVIGDALVRTLEHLGHHVVRQNHVGDWGTPFGMLIEHLLAVGEDSEEARLLVDRPNDFYQAAREQFD